MIAKNIEKIYFDIWYQGGHVQVKIGLKIEVFEWNFGIVQRFSVLQRRIFWGKSFFDPHLNLKLILQTDFYFVETLFEQLTKSLQIMYVFRPRVFIICLVFSNWFIEMYFTCKLFCDFIYAHWMKA